MPVSPALLECLELHQPYAYYVGVACVQTYGRSAAQLPRNLPRPDRASTTEDLKEKRDES